VKLRLSPRPSRASWSQVYGVAMLGGIGFTMSLFIAALAFPADGLLNETAKVGILLGSALSAIVGLLFLRFVARPGGR
ncbi:MAG TPA: Na(+)/H(+) antiporter NhaA, partial [Myxococcales bacterium]|nr:Na(+)/H(+) antiporter NhaA [Myxococcales bacterium]